MNYYMQDLLDSSAPNLPEKEVHILFFKILIFHLKTPYP